jgi:hypothetical protein
MPAPRFLRLVSGIQKMVEALQASAGAADADKVVATGADGRLDASLMPLGIGANTTIVPASEALTAGNFVNFFNDAGTLKARKADNTNGRQADGFVTSAVASAASATVYPMDGVNSGLTGLTVGTKYFLGTAGGVIAAPLDEALAANYGKLSQMLGVAKSTTELVTSDYEPVIL